MSELETAKTRIKILETACYHYKKWNDELEEVVALVRNGVELRKPSAGYQAIEERVAQEFKFFELAEVEKVRVSRAFNGTDEWLRYVTVKLMPEFQDKVLSVTPVCGQHCAILQSNPAAHVEVKALTYAGEQAVKYVTFQKFNNRDAIPAKESITFSEETLERLMYFLISVFLENHDSDHAMSYPISQIKLAVDQAAANRMEREAESEASLRKAVTPSSDLET